MAKSIAQQIKEAQDALVPVQERRDASLKTDSKYTGHGDYTTLGFGLEQWGKDWNERVQAGQAYSKSKEELDALQERAQADPWSFYRADAADRLARTSTEDPSDIYRSRLERMMTGEFNPDDPSYAWRFKQGQQALERSQAAKGLLGSGNAATELVDYGQGQASTEFQAQFARTLQALSGVQSQYDAQQNRLMRLAGVDTDPLGRSKIQAGITESNIAAQAQVASAALSAGAQNRRTSEDARQFNVQAQQNDLYQQGLGDAMAAGWGFE